MLLITMTVGFGLPAHAEGITDGYAKISNNFTIHYQTAGTGDVAIIFIPGWTMTTRAFEHQLEFFADSTEYQAVTYDPRAQGLTTRTTEGHYYEQRARDLQALVEHLDLEKIILVGWSAGGGDQLEYLRLYGSDNMAGLVLLDTTPKVAGTDFATEWVWFGTKDEGDQDGFFKWFSYDVMIDRQGLNDGFAEWMLEDPSAANKQFVNEMTNMTPDSFAALLNTSYWFLDNSADLIAQDGEIALLYFVRAEWEELATQWAADNTPSATVMTLADSKHMMFWERHEEFNAAFSTWLKENIQ